MAAYDNPGSGGDYFSDSSAKPSAPVEKPKSKEETEGKEQTAIIPKSMLAGKEFKPGEEVIFKVVRFHDDSVEIAYSYGDEGKEEKMPEKAPMPAGPPGGGDSEMAGMMY